MRPELSYIKIQESELISDHWFGISGEMPVSKWLPAQSAFVPEYIRWPDTKDLHDNYFYLTTRSVDSKGRHVSDLFHPINHFRCGNVVADGVNNGEFLR
eukprot:Nk52_evm1s1112 gene=Nk52_evmTU1s1112